MTAPLLATKWHVPRGRHVLVARSRLLELLGRGAALTLVSAPAGFGKTTLLTEWLADGGRRAAWLSLDRRDNDPATFWTYLVTALRTAVPEVGSAALALLGSSRWSIEEVLATLLNDLAAVPDDVVLVLDDYHVIDAREVHDGLAFLLEHLPPQAHLVITGRADPPLPLARVRGRGDLVEVRAADLRFTTDEAAAYLTGVMGLALTAADVATLEGRTEGWIAALQLAALSMRGRDDVGAFIAGFAGDDRYIVDYLAEEVLTRQPDAVRSFLLQTSVLDRLSGSLCDAVTGRDGGRAALAELERGNLFLVPLDHRRRWYRYHHLFADVLRAHLHDEQPGAVAELHRRASGWFARNSEPAEAIRHALAGGDVERAADLIELAIPATQRARQEATLRGWLEALPDEVIRVRPVLSNGYAGSLLVRGEVEGVEERLRDAEEGLDGDRFRRLPGAIAIHRAGLALMLGDTATTMAHARRALGLLDDDDHVAQGSAAALLGLAHWSRGELDEAHRRYAEGMARLERAGYLSDMLGCALALADIRITQGRLHEAMGIYERGLQVAGPVRGAADMHVGMAELLRERNHLDAAEQHLATARELGEHAGLPQNPYRSRMAAARLRAIAGSWGEVMELLDEAERVYTSDFFPEVRPIHAVRARMWIARGRLGEARAWMRERGVSADEELDHLREFEQVTLARLLLAQRSVTDATRLLDRLLRAADDGGRTGTVIEILVLQALTRPDATAALDRAVTLAAAEGQVRVFVDEGPRIAALLGAAARRGTAPAHVRRILDATTTTGNRGQALVDPLSERELDVLRLLGSDLSGPDIARRLVVSLHTVRTHTKHIYAKLGVTSRRAAVRRAEELDLMSHTSPHTW